jgi:ABC-type polysaccharide/polyol phosphate transport system ATPase subunit
MALIECVDVWKTFRLHQGKRLLRERLRDLFRKSSQHRFHALKGVSFAVEAGESVGIIGRNGAGKSTLLSLISGLAEPNRGHITVNGRVAPLLELGAGFHPDLTGHENLLLNAALMGFSEAEVRSKFDAIVEFAGIGDFINEPMRTYSSGMSMRLAFSIAVNVEPEILIVDEVLAVGDQAFQAKCLERIGELRSMGKTFLCVSHGVDMIRNLCDRAVWLDSGELILQGRVGEVLDAYHGWQADQADLSGKAQAGFGDHS